MAELANMIMGVVAVIMVGVLIGGAVLKTLNEADQRQASLEDKLDRYHRQMTLSSDPDLAEEQLKDATHLITLRSTHCLALKKSLEGVSGSSDTFRAHIPGDLRNATTVEEDSIGKLECIGSKSAVRLAGADAIAHPWDAVTDGVFSLVGLGDSRLEETDRVDQEGNVGNVKFTYPEDAEAPITMVAGKNPMKTGEISGPIPGNSFGMYLWEDSPVYFFPDPIIVEWVISPEDEDSYYVPPNAPAMKNVPMINNTPLFVDRPDATPKRVPMFPVNYGLKHDVKKLRYLSSWEGAEYDAYPYYGYEFVICPGTSGRIQSNAGSPHNTGEALKGAAYGENTAFPFVEIPENSGRECVEKYELGTDWSTGTDIDSEPVSDLTCEDYGDVRASGEDYREGTESRYYRKIERGGKTFELRCGLKRMYATTQNSVKPFWSVETFVREVG